MKTISIVSIEFVEALLFNALHVFAEEMQPRVAAQLLQVMQKRLQDWDDGCELLVSEQLIFNTYRLMVSELTILVESRGYGQA